MSRHVDARIVVRNSNHPRAGVVFFTRAEMDVWIKGVKAGELDGDAQVLIEDRSKLWHHDSPSPP